MVTGIGINASVDVGSVIIGTADIDVTGIQLNASLGNPFAFTDADVVVTGSSLTTCSIGSVTITSKCECCLQQEYPLTTAVGSVDHNSTYEVTCSQLSTYSATGPEITADDWLSNRTR
jgi:hypothetical protein